ncbi:hypothetical protein FBQ97_09115 [Acidobacteria bacterium ACD]|nr:hypothetical protein [Acidobacteria bacterium ACD]
MSQAAGVEDVPPFDRSFLTSGCTFTRIGSGPLGGKASGLLTISRGLARLFHPEAFPSFAVDVPRLTVLGADAFGVFLRENGLFDVALSGAPDQVIADAFQRGSLPAHLVGDLRALTEEMRRPLAVRSSSLLEDARDLPLAGVYLTKMLPNNQPDADARFRRLSEAVKLVYASTYFRAARAYRAAAGAGDDEERMAVIFQEVVGRRPGDRFYPHVSGVARSWAWYRTGRTRPEDGVAQLALGLGKQIVDGGLSWVFSPARPKARPPFASARASLKETQTEFWAVNMGRPPAHDPTRETEYLVRAGLPEAEFDGTLGRIASTYDAASDRLLPGIAREGPRVLDFAPILVHDSLPLNGLVRALLLACEGCLGGPVEIEFALTFEPGGGVRFALLQSRLMAVSQQLVEVGEDPPPGWKALVTSRDAMGNGSTEGIADVVWVERRGWEMRRSAEAAAAIAALNRRLVSEGRPYVLIGFGRWGSADPWLGIPVAWGDIAGARAIVEASPPERGIEVSQGSHFFHNLAGFRVGYLSVPAGREGDVDWGWLEARAGAESIGPVRHARLEQPLLVEVDGRSGRGMILRREETT